MVKSNMATGNSQGFVLNSNTIDQFGRKRMQTRHLSTTRPAGGGIDGADQQRPRTRTRNSQAEDTYVGGVNDSVRYLQEMRLTSPCRKKSGWPRVWNEDSPHNRLQRQRANQRG